MKKIVKPMLLICALVVICVLLVFVTDFFSHSVKNHEPIIIDSFKLDKIPDTVHISDDDIIFHYDDGLVQSVTFKDGAFEFNDMFTDVQMFATDYDGYYLLNSHNEFKYVSDVNSSTKLLFAKAVNEKAKSSPIVQMCSDDSYLGFTAVLFEDGSVMSDLNYLNIDTEGIDEFDFLILENVAAGKIYTGDYCILAVDKDNPATVHYYFSIANNDDLKGKYGYTTLGSPVVSIAASPFAQEIVLCEDGNIYTLNVYDAAWGEPFKAEKNDDYSNVNSFFGSGNFLLALSDGKLYHEGFSFLNDEPDCKCLPYIFTPEIIYESDSIKHYFALTNLGIIVILDDGTVKIIKN